MAIVRFKFSRKLYFCFESVIRQKFNFSAYGLIRKVDFFTLKTCSQSKADMHIFFTHASITQVIACCFCRLSALFLINSEMAQNVWFWLHWMKRNYVFVLVDDKVSKFKSIQNWNWKFLLNFLEIAIKVIHFMYYLI